MGVICCKDIHSIAIGNHFQSGSVSNKIVDKIYLVYLGLGQDRGVKPIQDQIKAADRAVYPERT